MSIYQNRLLKNTLPLIIKSASAHKKPRWLPVAKSKIYRIPKRPVVPEDERIELKRINDNYNTQMRAIRRFYVEEVNKEKQSLDDTTSELSLLQESKEWEQCVALNDKWNAQVALEREERRKTELVEMEQRAFELMEKREQEEKERMKVIAEEIKKQKEMSATFITPETLDAAIDHAIDNPVDYNFVIDLKGNRILGRDTPISPPKSLESDRAATSNA